VGSPSASIAWVLQGGVPGVVIIFCHSHQANGPTSTGEPNFTPRCSLDRMYQPSLAEDSSKNSTILFSAFRLEPDGAFFRGEAPIHLPPRELGALKLLLANAGQVVTPSQFKQTLWGDVHVTAESVPRCLSSLRARLQPDDCIQTVYKRGYRLIAEVRLQDVHSAGALPRLAIAPFATETGIPEHLGAVVAEETIARLSNSGKRLAALLARDSVFTLASNGLTALQIGQTLHADLVLAGSLRGLLSHFRLRAEMIRVSDGIQIWAEDLLVERERSGILEAELVARLEIRLQIWPLDSTRGGSPPSTGNMPTGHDVRITPSSRQARPGNGSSTQSANLDFLTAAAETNPEPTLQTQSGEAYGIFLRGHHEWQTLERHRMQDGLQHLNRAIELDPSLVGAKVDLAHLVVTQAMYGFMSPALSAELVHRTAASIADRPSQAPGILPAEAWVNFHFDRDLPAALRATSDSAHLRHDPWITRLRAMLALSRHRFAEAIAMLRAAIQLDPFSPWLNSRLAWSLHLDGQADKSIETVEHCLQLFPDHEGTALYGSQVLAFNGNPERAVQLAQSLAQRQPYFDLATSVLANALACDGRGAEALSLLERLQWLSRERFVMGAFNAPAYVALGAHEAALSELQASNDSRCPWFFQLLADPRLKPLHGIPGFQQLQAILPRMEESVAADLADSGPGSPSIDRQA